MRIQDCFKRNKKEPERPTLLKNQEEIETAKAVFMSEITHLFSGKISDAVLRGIQFERERIYQNYVVEIDKYEVGTDKWIWRIMDFLSFLRMSHLQSILNGDVKSDLNPETEPEGPVSKETE